MFPARLFATTLLALLICACSAPETTFEKIPANGKILAFGDSLTYGTGAARKNSYPAILQQLTGHTVINAGIPGEITARGVERLPGLLQQEPDLLILTHGGNDMLRKKDLRTASNNLRTMITMARDAGVPVIMLAVPNPTLILSPASFYEELAVEMGVPIENDALTDILQYPANKSDAAHPNAKGYRMMAERIHALLISIGALQINRND